MMLKNRKTFLLVIIMNFGLLYYAQKKESHFKFDFKYYFDESMTEKQKMNVWALKSKILADSSFCYMDEINKISIVFKIKNQQGACTFVLIDSLKGKIIKGKYKDGIALLKDQIDYVEPDGSVSVHLRKYYSGIADGNWNYFDFNGRLINSITYSKKIGK